MKYDDFGNQTSAETVDDLENPTMLIKTMTEYTEDGNHTYKSYDTRGYTITRNWNPADSTLTSAIDPGGQAVEYSYYDDTKRLKDVSIDAEDKKHICTYGYDKDLLTSIKHNTSNDGTGDVMYTFDYDPFGRSTNARVGNRTLYTNVYSDDRNGILKQVQYGNGGKIVYEHDDFNRLIGVKNDNSTENRFTYEYGANGEPCILSDTTLRRAYQTEYDLAERPCQSTQRDLDTGDLIYRAALTYDLKNRLKCFAESVPGEAYSTSYSYNADNKTTDIQFNDAAHAVSYTYDVLGRPDHHTITNGANAYTTTFTYTKGDEDRYGKGASTHLVETMNQGADDNAMNFAYVYNKFGSIESETRNTMTTTYEYDAFGQLVSVNDPHENAIWEYKYDCGGNITGKQKFARNADGTKGTAEPLISYQYIDMDWKDKLSSYAGNTIEYDAVGNVTNDGVWMYEWEAGHQLKKMTRIKEGVDSVDKFVEFKYNAKGLRVQKKVTDGNAVSTTDYILHGRRIMHEIVTESDANGNTITKEMHFFYGEDGRPAMVKFNGNYYTYVCNLQGDIVGIVDTAGSLVVEYKYDAWGKRIEALASDECEDLEKLNPFTYRGHVWDTETGLYYMRARYYSPEYCRFISPDKIKYLGADGNILSYNAYVYCNNNPVNMCDASGELGLLTIVFGWLAKNIFQITLNATVDIAVSYFIADTLGQEYTIGDALESVGEAIVGEIPFSTKKAKKLKQASLFVYNVGTAAYDSYSNGATIGYAIANGVISGASSTVGLNATVDNLQMFSSLDKGTELLVSSAWGLTFGMGEEMLVAVVTNTITEAGTPQKAAPIPTIGIATQDTTSSPSGGSASKCLTATR